MSRYWPVVAAVLLIGAAAIYGRSILIENREWETRVEMVLENSARLQEVVAEAKQEAADRAEAAARWKARADSAQARVPERIVEVREIPVPAECEPVVAVRDTIIDTLVVANAALDSAYEAQKARADILDEALVVQTARVDSLTAVLEDRPDAPAWWVPEIRPGVFAGACTDGRVCSGVGFTLTWRPW